MSFDMNVENITFQNIRHEVFLTFRIYSFQHDIQINRQMVAKTLVIPWPDICSERLYTRIAFVRFEQIIRAKNVAIINIGHYLSIQ